jgi:DNA-binding MltR family transcriptional regulator
MKRETDTGLVVVLTLWVEQELTDLLRAFFIRDPHVAPLLKGLRGKLDHKIALVYALGLFWRDQREDADLLKNIRNKFAHRVLTGTFRDRDVAELVDRLYYARSHPRRSRRVNYIHTAHRVVLRARLAKRMVKAMCRGKMSLGELRAFFSFPSVIPPHGRGARAVCSVDDGQAPLSGGPAQLARAARRQGARV